MSKHKKFGKVHISRMGYDLSKFYTAPRRKRERTESEAMKSNEKAVPALEHQGGDRRSDDFKRTSAGSFEKPDIRAYSGKDRA